MATIKQETTDDTSETINESEPPIALTFIIDISEPMRGIPTHSLIDGLRLLKQKACENEQLRDILEVSIISFNDNVTLVQDFIPVERMGPVRLSASGNATMSPAIMKALRMVEERSIFYHRAGTAFYTPCIVLISGEKPCDDIATAAREVREKEKRGMLNFIPLGVECYDSQTLHKLSDKMVLRLDGLDYTEFFDWLYETIMQVISGGSQNGRLTEADIAGNLYVDIERYKTYSSGLSRDKLEQPYRDVSDRIEFLISKIVYGVANNEALSNENYLSELKLLFFVERTMRGDLTKLLKEEFVSGEDQTYVAQLTKNFDTLDMMLGVYMYHEDCPFIYEWPEADQWSIWEENIKGFKAAVPAGSERFMRQLADIYGEVLWHMFKYNVDFRGKACEG